MQACSKDVNVYTIYIQNGISAETLGFFNSTLRAQCLTFDGTNAIAGSMYDAYINQYVGKTSTIQSSFAAPDATITGLAYDDATGNLISAGVFSKKIYIHNGISASIISSFASPSSWGPTGLTYDGAHLISIYNKSEVVYVHNGVTSTIVSSFAAASSDYNGLTINRVIP